MAAMIRTPMNMLVDLFLGSSPSTCAQGRELSLASPVHRTGPPCMIANDSTCAPTRLARATFGVPCQSGGHAEGLGSILSGPSLYHRWGTYSLMKLSIASKNSKRCFSKITKCVASSMRTFFFTGAWTFRRPADTRPFPDARCHLAGSCDTVLATGRKWPQGSFDIQALPSLFYPPAQPLSGGLLWPSALQVARLMAGLHIYVWIG
jgi:hypothetical protein